MNLKSSLLSIALFISQCHLSAQEEMVTNPLSKAEISFLNFITKDTVNDLNLDFFKENFRFGIPRKIANGITLIKHKKKLLIQAMGSGRLYQMNKIGESDYQLNRIDSTYHAGVNFGTINWIYHDTVFQFGGIGFWKIKDHFTFFSYKTHEWELFNSNKKVPVYQSPDNGIIYFIDQNNGKFYLTNSILQQDFPNTLTTISDDTCRVFDFKQRTWNELGKLNPNLNELIKKSKDFKTFYGSNIVFHSDLQMYWIDFSKNQFGSLSKNLQADFREKWLELYKGTPEHMYQFVMGSKFYLIKIDKDGILTSESIKMKDNDFIDSEAKPIYTNSLLQKFLKLTAPSRPVIGNVFVLLMAFLLYTFYNKRFKRKKLPVEVQSILYKNFFSALTIVEKELIQAIFQLQVKNEQISIKSINKIIGVHQKDTITQNKSRSDLFLRINQKFKLATRESELLIVKQREESDKRQYNYNINMEFIKQIEKLFLDNQ
jgi:hypothetical protein